MWTLKIGKKSFTLLETLIIAIILTILATLGLAGYTRAVENANAMSCQNNLMILNTAIELYGTEHPDALPTSLSSVWPAYKDKALAKLKIDFEKKGWFGIKEQYAYAAVLDGTYYGNDKSVITCPSDTTPPSKGGVSYGINTAFQKLSDLSDPAKVDLPFIGDSETATLTRPIYRHKSGLIDKDESYVVTGHGDLEEHKKNGEVRKIKKNEKDHNQEHGNEKGKNN